jgi:pyrroline-5-carboxylate reductase
MKNIVIIGAGDLGKELVWLIEDINKVNQTHVILGR